LRLHNPPPQFDNDVIFDGENAGLCDVLAIDWDVKLERSTMKAAQEHWIDIRALP